MIFNTGAALLDAIVLSVVAKKEEGTYGYKITQDVRKGIDVSESTLYPVLRRLQKDDCLETYDKQIDGRNRRYYRITDNGKNKLEMYRNEWISYTEKINSLLSYKYGINDVAISPAPQIIIFLLYKFDTFFKCSTAK